MRILREQLLFGISITQTTYSAPAKSLLIFLRTLIYCLLSNFPNCRTNPENTMTLTENDVEFHLTKQSTVIFACQYRITEIFFFVLVTRVNSKSFE